MTIGGHRPPRLSGDVVTFEDMRAWSMSSRCVSQIKMEETLARRRELVDSATRMMVADEFYDGKPRIDLS